MKRRLVIDIKLKRPACVLLQAGFGGDNGILHQYFDSEDWLVAPTADMRMIEGTPEEWKAFAEKHRKAGKR